MQPTLVATQEMRFVMEKRIERSAPVSSTLPVFTQAAAALLAGRQVASSEDGRKWSGLDGWLDPSSLKLVCRRTEIRITVPAMVRTDVSLLPITTEPQGSLAWTPRAGSAKTAALKVMLDLERKLITLVLPCNNEQYDEIVYALSTAAPEDCQATLTCQHTYQLRVPAPQGGAGRPAAGVLDMQPLVFQAQIRNPSTAPAAPAVPPVVRTPTDIARLAAAQNLQIRAITVDREVLAQSRTIRTPVIYTPPPAQPTLEPATLDQQSVLPLFARQGDEAVFLDLPRHGQSGWGQVPGRDQKSPLHFRDSGEPDNFFYLPSAFKLGFGRDETAVRPPMRAEMYLDDQGRHRVRVTLTALPFTEETDRAALREYLRESILKNTVDFVRLTLAGGLPSTFLPDFASTDGTGLPANIKFLALEVSPDKWLRMQFDMEAGSYQIFCELLRKGLRGRVVFSSPGIQHGVPVLLELEGVISDALVTTVDPQTLDVQVQSLLAHPAVVSSARASLLDRGPSTGLIFSSEELELMQSAQRIEANAQWKSKIVPAKIAGIDEVVISMGPVRVEGGAPQDWLDRVNRDPSLTPQPLRVRVTLSVLAFAAAQVELVQLRVMRDGETTPRRAARLTPGSAPLDLEVQLTLAELSGGTMTGLYLEYETLHKDGRLSQPQRQAIQPSQREIVVLALVDAADLVYTLAPVGAANEDLDRVRLAERVQALRQQPGARWEIYARTATTP